MHAENVSVEELGYFGNEHGLMLEFEASQGLVDRQLV